MVRKGNRIELISTDDPCTRLKPGDRGTVTYVGLDYSQDEGTIQVNWDSGSRLMLLIPEDKYRVLDQTAISKRALEVIVEEVQTNVSGESSAEIADGLVTFFKEHPELLE